MTKFTTKRPKSAQSPGLQGRHKGPKIWATNGDIVAILIGTSLQIVVAVTGYPKLSQMLREITAEVSYNVLQGRPIEHVPSDMRKSLHEKGEIPAR